MNDEHPFRTQPTMLVSEHEARVANSTRLLGQVNDKYEDLERRARSAALIWDADRKRLQDKIQWDAVTKDREIRALELLYNTNFGKYRWILGICCAFCLSTGLLVGKLL